MNEFRTHEALIVGNAQLEHLKCFCSTTTAFHSTSFHLLSDKHRLRFLIPPPHKGNPDVSPRDARGGREAAGCQVSANQRYPAPRWMFSTRRPGKMTETIIVRSLEPPRPRHVTLTSCTPPTWNAPSSEESVHRQDPHDAALPSPGRTMRFL